MTAVAYLTALAGLALATGLVAYQGVGAVFQALAVAGWGLLAVALFHLLPMALDALAWRALLPRRERPARRALLWMRWVREAVDGLLPVAQVGGEVLATRLLMLRGVPGAVAGASLVVDVTLAVLTQLLFTLAGLGLLLAMVGEDNGLTRGILIGLAVGFVALAAFVVAQHRGLFPLLARWLGRLAGGLHWLLLVGGAEKLEAEIRALYRHRTVLLAAGGWQLGSWVLGAGEVWLALHFLGHPVSFVEALILESLGQAVRSAAFAVPGAIGVQEGGYLLLVGLFGLGPEVGLALSLVKRVRELLLGIPALAAWQLMEGRLLLRPLP